MTVAELIALLQTMPPTTPVRITVAGYDDGQPTGYTAATLDVALRLDRQGNPYVAVSGDDGD